MKRYIRLTDTHFDFIKKPIFIEFVNHLSRQNVDGFFFTGDISNGSKIKEHFTEILKKIKKPIFITLGNHDAYDSDIITVRCIIRNLSIRFPNLIYLTESSPITIANNIALIGHDGWYDGGDRNSEILTSFVFLWDWLFIEDFRKQPSNQHRMELIRKLANIAADEVSNSLKQALQNHSTVYLLTHFPPWPEKHYKFGKIANDFWMPYNSSKIMAQTITNIMNNNPDKHLVVLSGHTHKQRIEQITNNIELRVGGGAHGKCKIEETIILPG